jgi:hypothetical protein
VNRASCIPDLNRRPGNARRTAAVRASNPIRCRHPRARRATPSTRRTNRNVNDTCDWQAVHAGNRCATRGSRA